MNHGASCLSYRVPPARRGGAARSWFPCWPRRARRRASRWNRRARPSARRPRILGLSTSSSAATRPSRIRSRRGTWPSPATSSRIRSRSRWAIRPGSRLAGPTTRSSWVAASPRPAVAGRSTATCGTGRRSRCRMDTWPTARRTSAARASQSISRRGVPARDDLGVSSRRRSRPPGPTTARTASSPCAATIRR